ncbi:MAG: hypothetical protein M3R59_06185 [Verrucomicrobiota bacterium]|nr:hypothetical protein [Verrucomicrobiota bacterium]
MKSLALFATFLCLARVAFAQDDPTLRPALIGSAPSSIINTIDTKALLARGQKDGVVQFCAAVDRQGAVVWSTIFGASQGSQALETEVRIKVGTGHMIPAIRKGEPISVLFYGTVTFRVIDGKTRLRIFANQEPAELDKESDFIAPQACLNGDVFVGFQYPDNQTTVPVEALVRLALKVDAQGNVREASVASEKPPLLGFGDAAIIQFGKAPFIPAFRNGKPVVCEFILPLVYQPAPPPKQEPEASPADPLQSLTQPPP